MMLPGSVNQAETADRQCPRLVVVSGLPGTGKSTIAELAARILACPLVSKDLIEATLWRSGIGAEAGSGWAAYELMTTLAEGQMRLGQSAVLDSVATYERIRARWRALAAEAGASFQVVECVCSDDALHRTRLDVRVRGIPGWYEIDWAQVERTRTNFEPWSEPRLVLDAAMPLSQNVEALRAHLAR